MKLIDFYTGYEIDRELVFTERNTENIVLFKIDLWYGYFDSIMRLISVTKKLDENGIYYSWQSIRGFYDDELWECKNVDEFLKQLLDINTLDNDLKMVIDSLKQICQSTIHNKNKLYLEYL